MERHMHYTINTGISIKSYIFAEFKQYNPTAGHDPCRIMGEVEAWDIEGTKHLKESEP